MKNLNSLETNRVVKSVGENLATRAYLSSLTSLLCYCRSLEFVFVICENNIVDLRCLFCFPFLSLYFGRDVIPAGNASLAKITSR